MCFKYILTGTLIKSLTDSKILFNAYKPKKEKGFIVSYLLQHVMSISRSPPRTRYINFGWAINIEIVIGCFKNMIVFTRPRTYAILHMFELSNYQSHNPAHFKKNLAWLSHVYFKLLWLTILHAVHDRENVDECLPTK